MAETAMRSQNFPVSESEALDEVVTNELFENLREVLEEPGKAIAAQDIQARIAQFSSLYKFRRMCQSGGSYDIPSQREA
jgi:hypothetical protein